MSPAAKRKDPEIRERLAKEMEVTVKALKHAQAKAEAADATKAEQDKEEK